MQNNDELINLIMKYGNSQFDKGFFYCMSLSKKEYEKERLRVDIEAQKLFKQILDILDK